MGAAILLNAGVSATNVSTEPLNFIGFIGEKSTPEQILKIKINLV